MCSRRNSRRTVFVADAEGRPSLRCRQRLAPTDTNDAAIRSVGTRRSVVPEVAASVAAMGVQRKWIDPTASPSRTFANEAIDALAHRAPAFRRPSILRSASSNSDADLVTMRARSAMATASPLSSARRRSASPSVVSSHAPSSLLYETSPADARMRAVPGCGSPGVTRRSSRPSAADWPMRSPHRFTRSTRQTGQTPMAFVATGSWPSNGSK